MRGLTQKQENFCNFYIESLGNASEAYRRAYTCNGWSAKTVWEKASAMRNKEKVAARIKELQAGIKDKSDVTKDRLLRELSSIAFTSIASLHNTWIERKDFESLTDSDKSAIKSISTKVIKKNIGTQDNPEIVDVEYVKIEMHDKLKAIERICKMLGFDAPTVVDLGKSLIGIDTGVDE